MILPQELTPYAEEHPIGERKLTDLKPNPAYQHVVTGMGNWMAHDSVLDVFLADRRDKPDASGGVARLTRSIKRASDPAVVETTNRCLTAIAKLLERGAIGADNLRAFAEAHWQDRAGDAHKLRVSDLMPEKEATSADRWAARELLLLYDAEPLETEVVRRWIIGIHLAHESERARVSPTRAQNPELPLEFIPVRPGKMVWEGRSIDIPDPFEVLSTPLLREQWEALGRPVRDEPFNVLGKPWFDSPVAFKMSEVPKLLEAIQKRDPRREYRLLTEDEWLFLVTDRGTLGANHWVGDGSALLEHAWVEENKADAPYLPAPVRGRRPTLVDGQKIWGLFGNIGQLVTPSTAVAAGARGHQRPDGKLVGGSLRSPSRDFTDPAHWIAPNFDGHGAIRVTRRQKPRPTAPGSPQAPTGGRP
jgi:hypothetical protein